MSRNVLITFSGARYHNTTERIVKEGPKFGATDVLVYDDWWLKNKCPRFMLATKALWDDPNVRGCCWFAWKPFIILDALSRFAKDDVIFYVDGDTYPVADLTPVFDITRRDDLMLFRSNGWPTQSTWCKRACFVIMEQDEPRYHLAPHGCARFMGFTYSYRSSLFLTEWQNYCVIKACTTFEHDPAYGLELPGHRQHRAEQAIMTNLAHKYGYRLYREACDSGEIVHPDSGASAAADVLLDRDLYQQLFQQDGNYSYAPGVTADTGQGSFFRNV